MSNSNNQRHRNAARVSRRAAWLAAVSVVSALASPAHAETFTVASEAELRGAIAQANASIDVASTIVLTSDIAVATTALPDVIVSHSLVIDTGAFTLTAPTTTPGRSGSGATFGGGAVTLVGTVRGGETASTATAQAVGAGGVGVTANSATITNQASVSGATGGSRFYSNNARGGTGGSGMVLTSSTLNNDVGGAITGGIGGSIDVGGQSTAGGNSFSGNGGVGAQITNGTLNNNGQIVGGAGGSTINSPAGGDNQWAGAGGTGVILIGGQNHTNSGSILGGGGGSGSNNAASGNGAAGHGLSLTSGSLLNSGTVAGADGIAGGGLTSGTGSVGGNAVLLSDAMFHNTGVVKGGNSGATIAAVANSSIGITGANATVINAGTITAGRNGNGTLAYAVQFTGGTNSLELRGGSLITGDVRAFGAGDTLTLGGDADATFDAAQIGGQFQNFGIFNKTGASTWDLTGTTGQVTSWNLLGGKLSVADDSNLGAASGTLNFDGGLLRVTGTTFTATARAINWGPSGGGFDIADAANTFTVDQVLTGAGALSKEGAGTLVLTGENTFAGGSSIAGGTLQVGNGGTSGSIAGNIANNGALIFNRSDDTSFGGAITGTGSLTQIGGGILRLAGDSSYSGNTRIDGSELRLENGGTITTTGTMTLAGPDATLTITGPGSSLNATRLAMGATSGGAVTLNIADGGQVRTTTTTSALSLGSFAPPGAPPPVATVNVSGSGSLLDVAGAVSVGTNSQWSARVNVSDGASVRSGNLSMGPTFTAMTNPSDVTVSGSGSTWTARDLFLDRGTLSLLDGGRIDATTGRISAAPGTQAGEGRALVSGAGSELAIAGALVVGFSGQGAVATVANGGRLSTGALLTLANVATSSGSLSIGAEAGAAAIAAGTVDVENIAFGPGAGSINLNHTDAAYAFGSAMSGPGTINQLAGVTLLVGDSSAFQGRVPFRAAPCT
jgi:fibronectin-binding autotransporter adhesin